VSLNELIVCRF